MRVLVTGGAGYIGSHVAKALATAGFEPVVLDDFRTGHRGSVRWGPLIEDDLSDPVRLTHLLRQHAVGAVIHMAADAYVGESVTEPRKYFRNNVANTINLLDAVLDAGIDRLVFSSSCATYGLPEHLPIPEHHPQRPVSPYGESKFAVERILNWYGPAYGFRWVALRFFNAAGADPNGELGEAHTPETHLVPLVIRAALEGGSPVQILGTDYPTPDGTAVRDYVHVSDLADAHVRALGYLQEGGPSLALNLGSGVGISVRQVIAAVELHTGRPIPFTTRPRRAGDPAILLSDARLAQRLLDWQPTHSGFEEIVATAWRWHSARTTIVTTRG